MMIEITSDMIITEDIVIKDCINYCIALSQISSMHAKEIQGQKNNSLLGINYNTSAAFPRDI